jgi:hypothetical protein
MKRKLLAVGGLLAVVCIIVGAFAYSLYIDFPSIDGPSEVRAYLPEEYSIKEAHYYQLRGFMDTWDLYRFTTSREAIDYLIVELKLESKGIVQNYPLIISKPPPYWWNPEDLPEAELFQSRERAPDGRLYDLLYSEDEGIVYMIRFDG